MVYHHVPHQNMLESLELPQVKVICQCHAFKPVFLVALQTIFQDTPCKMVPLLWLLIFTNLTEVFGGMSTIFPIEITIDGRNKL
jgi:hypothetical protein